MSDFWDNQREPHQEPMTGSDPTWEPVPPTDSDMAETTVVCWRCGREIAESLAKCPACAAPQSSPPSLERGLPLPRGRDKKTTAPADDGSRRIVRAIAVFAIFLCTTIVLGLVQTLTVGDALSINGPLAEQLFTQISIMECVDAVVVLAALFWVGRPKPLPRLSQQVRTGSWLVALPVLAVLLGLNVAYHAFILELTGGPLIEDEMVRHIRSHLWIVLVICLQPAIIEELFFRYLLLGAFRENMGVHTAVLISSMAFGMAHLGVPLSVPMLFVIGVALGYLRVASGSMLLPMAVHFFHNYAVLLLEGTL